MMVKALLITCWLMDPSLALAQATADPISGGWGMNGHTYLDLKYDGKGGVTGTVVAGRPGNLAPVKTGTFDTATGTLTLTGDARHPDSGATIAYVITGKLAGDTLSVNAKFDRAGGDFTLTKAGAVKLPVQTDAAAALKKSFSEVSGWVTQAADLVPADKYTYRPTPGVRTFGELVGHLADSYNYYCPLAAGRTVEWSDPIEKGSKDKTALVAKLNQAVDACATSTASTVDTASYIGNIAHTNLHYGNMVTYIRMLGLVPPSGR